MSTFQKRLLQYGLTGLFILVGLAIIASPGQRTAGILPLLMAGVVFAVLAWQIRAYQSAGADVKANIEACARSLFDGPGVVVPGYDLEASLVPTAVLARLTREPANDAAFTAQGRYGDATVSFASHVSQSGRQLGESHHTYSHVLVDVLGLNKTFFVQRERLGAKLQKVAGVIAEVKVGDPIFDDMFIVSTDEAMGKAVFADESIRRRLLELQSQVGNVSSDLGVGGMNVVLTGRGLALRWPGALTTELAASIRDLLLDMRARLLEHENSKAVRVGIEAAGVSGYRVGLHEAEAESAPAVEEPLEVEARHRK